MQDAVYMYRTKALSDKRVACCAQVKVRPPLEQGAAHPLAQPALQHTHTHTHTQQREEEMRSKPSTIQTHRHTHTDTHTHTHKYAHIATERILLKAKVCLEIT